MGIRRFKRSVATGAMEIDSTKRKILYSQSLKLEVIKMANVKAPSEL